MRRTISVYTWTAALSCRISSCIASRSARSVARRRRVTSAIGIGPVEV